MAFRYLFGSKGRRDGSRFLRFIMVIAIGGVAVGVAALLLSLSIVRGFSQEIEAKIIGFGAHIQVESILDAPLDRAPVLTARLEQFPEVARVAPVINEFVLLRHSAAEIDGVTIWGTDAAPSYLEAQIQEGTFRFEPDSSGRPGIVVGRALARLLTVEVGDLVTAFSVRPESDGGVLGRPRIRQFRVTGIYETSLDQFDEIYAFTDLAVARALFDYGPGEVTRLDLTLHDIDQVESVMDRIAERFDYPVWARTIFQVYSGLFAWVNLQQGIIPLVIGIIIIVAAVNIVGILLMVILEHSRSIGILASMGTTRGMLKRVYMFLGVLVGVVGVVIGEVMALGFALIQQRFHVIPLPAEAYYMSYAPVELNGWDFVLVAIIALMLCALASYVPARVAARLEPIRAIRFR